MFCQVGSKAMSQEKQSTSAMRRKPQQNRSKERVNQILDVTEQMLIEVGNKDLTTRAIAVRCGIPVGSLYQFFPDKDAIILALAERYNKQITDLFRQLHIHQIDSLSLSEYVELLIDTFNQFCIDHVGYQAMFTQIQELIPELLKKDVDLNVHLVGELGNFLLERKPELGETKVRLIALVLVEVVSTLLWVSFEQEPTFRKELISETKFLVLTYLQQFFNDNFS
jgi:AcrR family transcriptional regulator